jgi:hypothetical protein
LARELSPNVSHADKDTGATCVLCLAYYDALPETYSNDRPPRFSTNAWVQSLANDAGSGSLKRPARLACGGTKDNRLGPEVRGAKGTKVAAYAEQIDAVFQQTLTEFESARRGAAGRASLGRKGHYRAPDQA